MDYVGTGAVGALPSHHLLLSEFVHRSANDFAVACAELYGAARELPTSHGRDQLTSAANRLRALSAIQRLLLPRREPLMDLAGALSELCLHHAVARFAGQEIAVTLRAREVKIATRQASATLLIVSELLTNAACHAFRKDWGNIEITIDKCGDQVVCTVSDDGVGIDPGSARDGAGTTIIQEVARDAGVELRTRPCSVGSAFELRMVSNAEY